MFHTEPQRHRENGDTSRLNRIRIDFGERAYGAACPGDRIATVNRLAPLFGNVVRKAVVHRLLRQLQSLFCANC